ncbi:MAG: hypothetical protein AAF550_04950 [Myxococcota bacterium]
MTSEYQAKHSRAKTAQDGSPEFVPYEIHTSLPAGTTHLPLGAQPLSIGTGSLRSAFVSDLDQDGHTDALWIHETAEGIELKLSLGDGSGYRDHRTLRPARPTDCPILQSRPQRLSHDLALFEIEQLCGQDKRTHHHWILASLDAAPRALEELSTKSLTLQKDGQDAGPQTRLSLQFRGLDLDQDGHTDVELTVRVSVEVLEPVELRLTMWNRPSGLTTATEEPRETLVRLGEQASRQLDANPDQSEETARRADLVFEALCRSSKSAYLELGPSRGLSCGGLPLWTSIKAIVASAQIAAGRFDEGLTMLGTLPTQLKATDKAILDRGFRRAPILSATSRIVGTHTVAPIPALRLPSLQYLENGDLLVRGEHGRIIQVASNPALPSDSPGGASESDLAMESLQVTHTSQDNGLDNAFLSNTDQSNLLILDPSGSLAAVDLRSDCDGYHLSIARTEHISAGALVGPTISEPVFGPTPPRPCETGATHTPYTRALWLGWAPQGLVMAIGSSLWVVPITISGQQAGPSRPLSDSPMPAPFRTRASTDYWALGTAHGVLRFQRAGRTVLLRSDDWYDVPEPATDAALRSDARAVALIRGETIYVVELSER